MERINRTVHIWDEALATLATESPSQLRPNNWVPGCPAGSDSDPHQGGCPRRPSTSLIMLSSQVRFLLAPPESPVQSRYWRNTLADPHCGPSVRVDLHCHRRRPSHRIRQQEGCVHPPSPRLLWRDGPHRPIEQTVGDHHGRHRLRALMLTQSVFGPFALTHPETMWALLELMVSRVRQAESSTDRGWSIGSCHGAWPAGHAGRSFRTLIEAEWCPVRCAQAARALRRRQ